MSQPTYTEGLTIRTVPAAKRALARIVADLKHSPRVRFFGGKVSQEAVVNAVWLWLETVDPATLEDAMIASIARLEATMEVAAAPSPSRTATLKIGGTDPPVSETITSLSHGQPRGRKRRSP